MKKTQRPAVSRRKLFARLSIAREERVCARIMRHRLRNNPLCVVVHRYSSSSSRRRFDDYSSSALLEREGTLQWTESFYYSQRFFSIRYLWDVEQAIYRPNWISRERIWPRPSIKGSPRLRNVLAAVQYYWISLLLFLFLSALSLLPTRTKPYAACARSSQLTISWIFFFFFFYSKYFRAARASPRTFAGEKKWKGQTSTIWQ